MKKILVLCDHGQVRSVAMASVLRERGHFAVAGAYDNAVKAIAWIEEDSFKGFTPIEEYIDAFDQIIFMQEGGSHFIGRDEWGDCMHPELIEKCRVKAKELGL